MAPALILLLSFMVCSLLGFGRRCMAVIPVTQGCESECQVFHAGVKFCGQKHDRQSTGASGTATGLAGVGASAALAMVLRESAGLDLGLEFHGDFLWLGCGSIRSEEGAEIGAGIDQGWASFSRSSLMLESVGVSRSRRSMSAAASRLRPSSMSSLARSRRA